MAIAQGDSKGLDALAKVFSVIPSPVEVGDLFHQVWGDDGHRIFMVMPVDHCEHGLVEGLALLVPALVMAPCTGGRLSVATTLQRVRKADTESPLNGLGCFSLVGSDLGFFES